MHPVFKDKVFWFFIIKISVWLFFSIIWIHSVKEWESSWFLLIMLIVIIGYTIRNFIFFLSYFRYCDKIFRTNLPHKTGTCFLQIFFTCKNDRFNEKQYRFDRDRTEEGNV